MDGDVDGDDKEEEKKGQNRRYREPDRAAKT